MSPHFLFKMEIVKKAYSEAFEKILSGEKKFDIRLNDFEVDEGDVLVLKEIDSERKFTGREIRKKVTSVSKTKRVDWWADEEIIKNGFVVMSLGDER